MMDIKLAAKSLFRSTTILTLVTIALTRIVSLLDPVGSIVSLVAAFPGWGILSGHILALPFRLAAYAAKAGVCFTFFGGKRFMALLTGTKRSTVIKQAFPATKFCTSRFYMGLV